MTHRVLQNGILCWLRNHNQDVFASPVHSHAGVELLYCEQGRGIFTLGRHVLPYESGSLILFDPQVPHHVEMLSSYARWNVCFLSEALKSVTQSTGKVLDTVLRSGSAVHFHLDRLDLDDREHVYGIFRDIRRESLRQRLGFQYIFALRLLELFVLLERFSEESVVLEDLPRTADQALLFNDVIGFIERHIAHNVTVGHLADHFNVSTSTLYRMVRGATGRSPSELISQRRLARAQHLLAATTLTVSEVASATGYTHVSHFGSLFKQQTGYTPSQYRKLHREKAYETNPDMP